ncbi:MAG: multifunctional CCA addition/repair protein [Methylococcaceae bacterium]|jgi:tRNA nucleotidyltransferase (CCA-adding enzyme)
MRTYLVGGAVRDSLLGLPVKEKDWVVLGETPETLQKMGFLSVGKDFPVFLHPITKEEYALARTERKTAPGYKGFAIHSSPDVTLEQDLIRRDLTINAIAMSPNGELVDPYGGQADLAKRVLRHVSPAFSEDPVRILRVARFAARFQSLGFTVAEETRALMQEMVNNAEVAHLVPERVWAELLKALQTSTPSAFFYTLKACSALTHIFPEIDRLFGIPQPEKFHPEIDTGIHTLLCLDRAAQLTENTETRFAALTHDLGKALTPKNNWPHHHNHETLGLAPLENFCKRLRAPNTYKNLAIQVMQYHTHCHRAYELKPSTLTDMLSALNAFKPDNTLADFLLACKADAQGRTNFEASTYPQADYLEVAAKVGAAVDISKILQRNLQGQEIGLAIRQLRITALTAFAAQQKALS